MAPRRVLVLIQAPRCARRTSTRLETTTKENPKPSDADLCAKPLAQALALTLGYFMEFHFLFGLDSFSPICTRILPAEPLRVHKVPLKTQICSLYKRGFFCYYLTVAQSCGEGNIHCSCYAHNFIEKGTVIS